MQEPNCACVFLKEEVVEYIAIGLLKCKNNAMNG